MNLSGNVIRLILGMCCLFMTGCSNEPSVQPEKAATGDMANRSALASADSSQAPPAEPSSGVEPPGGTVLEVPKVVNLLLSPTPIRAGVDLNVEVVSTAQEGQTVNYRYAWFINDTLYNFALGETLPGDAFQRGDRVYVEVTPGVEGVEGVVFRSDIFEIPNAVPTITSKADEGYIVDGVFRYPVTATDVDGDSYVFGLERAPEGMSVDPQGGLVVWDTRTAALGTYKFDVLVTDEQGGLARQRVTITLGNP